MVLNIFNVRGIRLPQIINQHKLPALGYLNKRVVSGTPLRKAYFAYVQSLLHNGIIAWGIPIRLFWIRCV